MKTFEISNKKTRNGRRKFKAVLHEIYPDDCVDTVNECGTMYNRNGITWIEEYCRNALPTIENMSLRAEFLNEERDEICGHGDTGVEDGLPLFENADVIGHFTKGYIDVITDDDGSEKTVCIGEGYIDEMCYKNFVSKLDEDVANGKAPHGSIEIYRTENNSGIGYLYGYKQKGRIPTEFIYSGYALLGVMPADNTAKLLELNNKEESAKMNEAEIKNLIAQTVEEFSAHTAEINQCKADCDTKVNEANAKVEAITAEKNEAIADVDKLKAALEACQNERDEACKKLDNLWEEMKVLREELAKAQAEKRVGEMNAAIADFTDEEKEYAKAEIEAFNENPIESEINAIVSKIYEGIGKKTKTDASVINEQNSVNNPVADIFGEVDVSISGKEDTNIF